MAVAFEVTIGHIIFLGWLVTLYKQNEREEKDRLLKESRTFIVRNARPSIFVFQMEIERGQAVV
tara:strand:- start:88 stop:279 length:192 start_codon:yes stop_codon:yes gene_type:complete